METRVLSQSRHKEYGAGVFDWTCRCGQENRGDYVRCMRCNLEREVATGKEARALPSYGAPTRLAAGGGTIPLNRLRTDIRARLAWGESPATIRRSLLQSGHPAAMVEKLVSEATLERRSRSFLVLFAVLLCAAVAALAWWTMRSSDAGAEEARLAHEADARLAFHPGLEDRLPA